MKGRPDVRRAARGGGRDGIWIHGPHVVAQWLTQPVERVRRVFFEPGAAGRLEPLLETARRRQVATEPRDRNWLAHASGSENHQGVVAEVTPFPYATLADVRDSRPDLILAVDQIQDPHNLGAMIRSAAAAGAGAVVLPRDGAVGVTASVESAAVGTTALVRIVQVVNLARSIDMLKETGFWAHGLDGDAETSLFADFVLASPSLLIVGGERGIRPLVRASCDRILRIPMAPGVESLNASVAAALALFEFRRRIG